MSEDDVRTTARDARLDGLPEPGRRAEPVDPRRRPGRRGVPIAGRRRGRGAPSARSEMLRKVQISDPARRHAPLPAPALGRDAAARRDRDGAGQGPDAADPRRADDRPRRDGRGRGARPGRGAARASSARRVLFISHNLGVIAKMCDRVGVLYAGRLVEEGPVRRRCSTTRATRTRSGCCAASRAAACARTASGSTRSRASCPSSAPTLPAACSPTAAGSRRTSAAREEPPLYDLGGARHSAAATSTSRRTSCRAPTPGRAALAQRDRRGRRAGRARRGRAQDVPPGGPRRPRGRRRLARAARAARRSASSASRAAARRRSPGCCSG